MIAAVTYRDGEAIKGAGKIRAQIKSLVLTMIMIRMMFMIIVAQSLLQMISMMNSMILRTNSRMKMMPMMQLKIIGMIITEYRMINA